MLPIRSHLEPFDALEIYKVQNLTIDSKVSQFQLLFAANFGFPTLFPPIPDYILWPLVKSGSDRVASIVISMPTYLAIRFTASALSK